MSTLRRIAEIPAGSWTKWLVVGFWVVVLVLAFPLSKKLTGAEKNDTSQWLPAAPSRPGSWTRWHMSSRPTSRPQSLSMTVPRA
jgi:hypothetical protein